MSAMGNMQEVIDSLSDGRIRLIGLTYGTQYGGRYRP